MRSTQGGIPRAMTDFRNKPVKSTRKPAKSTRKPAKFTRKPVKFTLQDVGSEVIDQLSTDIYTSPHAILRELVKNAYDAYLPLAGFDDVKVDRKIIVHRARTSDGIGRLYVSDNGIGQTLEDLKANVQISVSRKPRELDNATGFRGLGSWALLGAGSRVVITSTKYGDPQTNRLVLDVRAIYKRLSPDTSLDDILNNKRCVSFSQIPASREEHFTVIEITCDGEQQRIHDKYELNRLHAYTDPEEKELRRILIRSCPIPFTSQHTLIYDIYNQTGYVPTELVLDGQPLYRSLPETLSSIQVEKIEAANGDLLAWAWTAEDPEKSKEVDDLHDSCNIDGPGIQLVRYNVPLGRKGLFIDQFVSRPRTARWYVGEVHIVAPDVLPDASGDGLRASGAREQFIQRLENFYKVLEERGVAKSERISAARKLSQAIEACEKIGKGGLGGRELQRERSKIANAVELIEISQKTKATSKEERRLRTALKDQRLKALRDKAQKQLKANNYLEEFATSNSKSKRRKSGGSRNPRTSPSPAPAPSPGLQVSFARLASRLKEASLTSEQIDKVLGIVRELFFPDFESGSARN
jgi:hypothetical protein